MTTYADTLTALYAAAATLIDAPVLLRRDLEQAPYSREEDGPELVVINEAGLELTERPLGGIWRWTQELDILIFAAGPGAPAKVATLAGALLPLLDDPRSAHSAIRSGVPLKIATDAKSTDAVAALHISAGYVYQTAQGGL